METKVDRSWYRCLTDCQEPVADVYWFPHAGGGSAALARTARTLRPDIRFAVAVLPGREERYGDPPAECVEKLADRLAEEIATVSRPVVLVGHSMGAVIAYLTAKRLVAQARPPSVLAVAAAAPPDRLTVERSLNQLDDVALLDELDRCGGGVPAPIRENPEALRIFLPVVRSDLALLDGFSVPDPPPAIPVPVMAFAGSEDRMVPAAHMMRWRAFTNSLFRYRTCSGDHFFPLRSAPELIDAAVRMACPSPAF